MYQGYVGDTVGRRSAECAVYEQVKVGMLEMFGGLVHSKMADMQMIELEEIH